MTIGTRSRQLILIFAIMLCLGAAIKRIHYVYHNFTLKELENHEKGN